MLPVYVPVVTPTPDVGGGDMGGVWDVLGWACIIITIVLIGIVTYMIYRGDLCSIYGSDGEKGEEEEEEGMTDDIDPRRLRLTEEGRRLLDTGIRDCPFCGKQPQIWVQKATGRYCMKCNNLVERSWTRCGEMDTCGRPMEKAVEKWNRKVDKIYEKQEREKMKEDKYEWVRVR